MAVEVVRRRMYWAVAVRSLEVVTFIVTLLLYENGHVA